MKSLVTLVENGARVASLARIPAQPLLTLRRPMKLFKSTLGLVPGVAAPPDPDFLVRLHTDYDSHQEWLRAELGAHYPNFYNAVRGRHIRDTTKRALSNDKGLSVPELEAFIKRIAPGGQLAQASEWEHLAPGIPMALLALHSIPAQLHKLLMSRPLPCPRCGTNVLQDIHLWWAQRAPGLAEGDRQFVDELLTTLVYLELISRLQSGGPELELNALVDVRVHPIGVWLKRLCSAAGLHSLSQLVEDAPDKYQRLKKWSSGTDLPSVKKAQDLYHVLPLREAAALGERLTAELHTCRTLALVIDFIEAASSPQLSRKQVLALIPARLEAIRNNLALGLHHASSKASTAPGRQRAPSPTTQG